MSKMRTKQELHRLLLQTSPLLTRAGLISLDEDLSAFTTLLGRYSIEDDPVEAITDASLQLEAELPRYYALRLDGENIIILQRSVDDNGDESLIDISTDALEEEDIDVLMSMVSAQGGMFKRYGTFRFDLNLYRQGLLNCSHCGEIWKSSKQIPLRCPRCRNELPESSSRGYRNVTEPKFDFLSYKNIQDTNFDRLNNDDLMLNEIRPLYNKLDYKMEVRDENADSLNTILTLIAEEYDAEHLNLVRLPELNSGIIELLKETETSIRKVLHEAGFREVWTDSVRPIGNWPHTAWISFGLRQEKSEDDTMPSLSCMLLLDISSPRWALCILPNVKELKKAHGQEWLYRFNPVREMMRSRINTVENGLVSTEGEPDIDVVPNSPGARMLSASIAHTVIEPERDGASRVKRKILVIMEAYSELV